MTMHSPGVRSTETYRALEGTPSVGAATLARRAPQFMSTFIDALHHSPQLNRQNRNFRAAMRAVNPAAPKQKVSDLVSELTGGPDRYFGRPLKLAHAHLQITESDWKIAVVELQKILFEHKVNTQDQEEFLAHIASSKGDIVMPSLYERLGKREGIFKLMSASIDSLDNNEQLLRQNPKIASVRGLCFTLSTGG